MKPKQGFLPIAWSLVTFLFRFILSQLTLLCLLNFFEATLWIVSNLSKWAALKNVAFTQSESFRNYEDDQVNNDSDDEKRQKDDANQNTQHDQTDLRASWCRFWTEYIGGSDRAEKDKKKWKKKDSEKYQAKCPQYAYAAILLDSYATFRNSKSLDSTVIVAKKSKVVDLRTCIFTAVCAIDEMTEEALMDDTGRLQFIPLQLRLISKVFWKTQRTEGYRSLISLYFLQDDALCVRALNLGFLLIMFGLYDFDHSLFSCNNRCFVALYIPVPIPLTFEAYTGTTLLTCYLS